MKRSVPAGGVHGCFGSKVRQSRAVMVALRAAATVLGLGSLPTQNTLADWLGSTVVAWAERSKPDGKMVGFF